MNTLLRKNGTFYPAIFDSVVKNSIDQFIAPNYSTHRPPVNVVEVDGNYRIELAVPGFKKEDFNVNLEEGKLTISLEVKSESEEKSEKYTRKEFSFQSFKRSFTLPDSVDVEKISGSYEAGILVLTLPKKEVAAAPSARQIEIA
jgi:HSP20 family protein